VERESARRCSWASSICSFFEDKGPRTAPGNYVGRSRTGVGYLAFNRKILDGIGARDLQRHQNKSGPGIGCRYKQPSGRGIIRWAAERSSVTEGILRHIGGQGLSTFEGLKLWAVMTGGVGSPYLQNVGDVPGVSKTS